MANILLVDDQRYVGEFLAEELSPEGHVFTCVDNEDSLMDQISDREPDLILLDLFLEGFRGWDLLREIRNRVSSRVPVLIFTAYDTFRDDPRLADTDGYVIKNFNTDELKLKITEALYARSIESGYGVEKKEEIHEESADCVR